MGAQNDVVGVRHTFFTGSDVISADPAVRADWKRAGEPGSLFHGIGPQEYVGVSL